MDLLSQDRQLVFNERPALTGPAAAGDNLLSVERLGRAAALADHQDDGLLGSEPAAALRARPAPADRGSVLGRPAVNHPAVRVPAVRAVHAITPCRPLSNRS